MPDRNQQGLKNIAPLDKRKGLYVIDKQFSKGKEYELQGATSGFLYHYNIVLLKHDEMVNCKVMQDILYLYRMKLPWKK